MRSLIIGLSLLMSYPCFSQCRGIDFETGVAKKLISADLFNTSINSDFMGCPKFTQGDGSLCGTVNNNRDAWDIGLPDGLLFSTFFEPAHYAFNKDVFKDPFFLSSISKIPEPSAEAMKWFEKRNISHVVLLANYDKKNYPTQLDLVQRKMITVMSNIKSWTYCPEERNLGPYTIQGAFDKENNIIIYKTACRTVNVYGTDINALALIYRTYFVCAHELSHAIDQSTSNFLNQSDNDIQNGERRANVNGLILTLAFSRLINQMLEDYKVAVRKSDIKAPCDEYFLKQTIKKWDNIEDFLIGKIKDAKSIYGKKLDLNDSISINQDWNIRACLELNKLRQN